MLHDGFRHAASAVLDRVHGLLSSWFGADCRCERFKEIRERKLWRASSSEIHLENDALSVEPIASSSNIVRVCCKGYFKMADLSAFVHDRGYLKVRKALVWDAVNLLLKLLSLEQSGQSDPNGIRTRVTAVKGRCYLYITHY